VLSELTLLSSRTELYFRFIRRRVSVISHPISIPLNLALYGFFLIFLIIILSRLQSDLEIGVPDEGTRVAKMNVLEKLLQVKNGISHSMQEFLGQYIMLEAYFLRESISKAVDMDTILEPAAMTSSIVDDVFFLVKKSIRFDLTLTLNIKLHQSAVEFCLRSWFTD